VKDGADRSKNLKGRPLGHPGLDELPGDERQVDCSR